MEVFEHPDITSVVEYIKNKLYFVTLIHEKSNIQNSRNIHFFSTDFELTYKSFYNDFGPLNLACLYKYCCIINEKLKSSVYKGKQIVHYTSQNLEKRANAVYLISSYAVLYLNKTPIESFKLLNAANCQPIKPFQDASVGLFNYQINVLDCLNALKKAVTYGFVNFENFDVEEYEKYSDYQKGDLNWLLPRKFLAFLNPSTEAGTLYHPPERYINYFIKNNVVAVVRLNRKTYEAHRFTKVGIMHYDMFMPDGSVPSKTILQQFLLLAETTKGAIAVHCKAGLGRTGSLIAAYLIKHYKMSAKEAIAWIRICRPGSVIGRQQTWLESMESSLWQAGEQFRLKYYGSKDKTMNHKRGIYSIENKNEKKKKFDQQKYEKEICNRTKRNKLKLIS